LSSFHQDFGDAKEELDVLYEGPPLEVGFNARYLLDALQVMDTSFIYMELKDEGSPCTLRPETSKPPSDQLCIVMPMRI
jgi:DNA polymerase-3 subunit beta